MKYSQPIVLILAIAAVLPVAAEAPIQSEAVAPEHHARSNGSRPFPRTGKIIEQYIAEKTATGEIDATEYQQLKAQRDALRQDIKSLRATGDEEAAEEKIRELRQQRMAQRDYVRNLVQEQPELRQRIIDHRRHVHRWQLERRRDIIDRRMERLRDRRQRDNS